KFKIKAANTNLLTTSICSTPYTVQILDTLEDSKTPRFKEPVYGEKIFISFVEISDN
ncbi:unnamed protein product, partial [Allacma fusca]